MSRAVHLALLSGLLMTSCGDIQQDVDSTATEVEAQSRSDCERATGYFEDYQKLGDEGNLARAAQLYESCTDLKKLSEESLNYLEIVSAAGTPDHRVRARQFIVDILSSLGTPQQAHDLKEAFATIVQPPRSEQDSAKAEANTLQTLQNIARATHMTGQTRCQPSPARDNLLEANRYKFFYLAATIYSASQSKDTSFRPNESDEQKLVQRGKRTGWYTIAKSLNEVALAPPCSDGAKEWWALARYREIAMARGVSTRGGIERTAQPSQAEVVSFYNAFEALALELLSPAPTDKCERVTGGGPCLWSVKAAARSLDEVALTYKFSDPKTQSVPAVCKGSPGSTEIACRSAAYTLRQNAAGRDVSLLPEMRRSYNDVQKATLWHLGDGDCAEEERAAKEVNRARLEAQYRAEKFGDQISADTFVLYSQRLAVPLLLGSCKSNLSKALGFPDESSAQEEVFSWLLGRTSTNEDHEHYRRAALAVAWLDVLKNTVNKGGEVDFTKECSLLTEVVSSFGVITRQEIPKDTLVLAYYIRLRILDEIPNCTLPDTHQYGSDLVNILAHFSKNQPGFLPDQTWYPLVSTRIKQLADKHELNNLGF